MRALVTAALLLASCKKTLGGEGGTEHIRRYFESQLGPVEDVRCPDSTEVAAGREHVCTIRFAQGEQFDVRVKQVDERGNVRFDLTEIPVATARVSPAIATWLREQSGQDARVDCGTGVRRFRADGTYACNAQLADGRRHTVVVRLDQSGSYVWNVH
jgi:hypothetical protein